MTIETFQCPSWSQIPSSKDYMVVNASVLEHMSINQGISHNGHSRLTDELCLFPQLRYVFLLSLAPFDIILRLSRCFESLPNNYFAWSQLYHLCATKSPDLMCEACLG